MNSSTRSSASARRVRPWRWSRQGLRQDLQQRHALRLHGFVLGALTLLLMWGASWALMHLGVRGLALRYALTLALGYGGYLLLIRWWAAQLVDPPRDEATVHAGDVAEASVDLADLTLDAAGRASARAARSLGSGFADTVPQPLAEVGTSLPETGMGDAWGHVTGKVLEGAGDSGDAGEAGIVVLPLVLIFVVVGLLVAGLGSLALLYFGWDVLLAVAVELAFSYAAGRSATQAAREGWLSTAFRLTWKPLLGAGLCAVALGGVIDVLIPQAHSLPEVIRLMGKP